jgi:hypothetical protein
MTEKTYEGTKKTFQDEKSAAEALHNKEGKCFDCDCDICVGEEEIENGSLLAYEDEGEEFFVFKCSDCFSKSEGLEDYKKCEVYSRIVGYLRPVNQWNEGKKQEYTERKEYNISEE